MEKTIVGDTLVNSISSDVLIKHYARIVKDDEGKPVYTNKEKGLCKAKGAVMEVEIYVKHKDYFIKASLSPYAIKKIHAHIVEIENSDLEEKEEE